MTEETRKIMFRKLADYLMPKMADGSLDNVSFQALRDIWQEAWICGVGEYVRTHPQEPKTVYADAEDAPGRKAIGR